jgi:predicted XRE-type DNA-binding protein
MNATRRKTLEAAGVIFEDADDFLELTDEERSLVDLRLAVSTAVRNRRMRRKLTQHAVAKKLKTSQPNVSKIENGSRDVSLDQMFRAYFALGGRSKDILRLD